MPFLSQKDLSLPLLPSFLPSLSLSLSLFFFLIHVHQQELVGLFYTLLKCNIMLLLLWLKFSSFGCWKLIQLSPESL